MKSKKVLFYDRGLYVYVAQKLGQYFDKVWYFMPDSSPYPKSSHAEIATGLPEIERVYDFWDYVDKADLIVFPDVNDGDLQAWLRSKGYKVFGSGKSENIELDKIKFLDSLDKAGLPIPYTHVTESLDELVEYLKGKTNKYLKTPIYRGDFETYHYVSFPHFEPFLDDLRCRLGRHAENLKVLVQNPIEAECEAGYDGFCVDGKFTKNCLCGYEVKDRGYVTKVFNETPEIIDRVNLAMSPYLKDCRGHWSTEIRINKNNRPYFIDPTPRIPSPPGELMTEIYSNYAQMYVDIADGKLPEPKPVSMYGAEIVLSSDWHIEHDLCIEFPDNLSKFIKLKNHTKRGKVYYCIPNENDGAFGAVVGWGKSLQAAISNVLDVANEIKAHGLKIDQTIFDEAQESVKAGVKFGIEC